MQRGLWITLPASLNSATARCFWSAIAAKLSAVLSSAGGGRALTAAPVTRITADPASVATSAFMGAASRFADGTCKRQRVKPLARQLGPCVGDRGRDRRNAGLADAGGFLRRLDDVHLDIGHLVDAQHAIVVEVRLSDASILQIDGAVHGRGQPVAHAA